MFEMEGADWGSQRRLLLVLGKRRIKAGHKTPTMKPELVLTLSVISAEWDAKVSNLY